ncbi:MAG: sugar transferase [Synergistaceae bacterium]|nr:sugar transferase [Synergistaceae bacterium]
MKPQRNFNRIISSLFQAVIDALIYHLSFYIVIAVWLSGHAPRSLTFEVMEFFTGTMLAVFYFNSLYSFKTWMFWDEMKAVLKSSVLILLVIVLYLYSQKFDISRFTLAMGIIIFIPLCLASRYLFRRLIFALGIISTNIIILGAGRTGTIFAEKINTHPFTLGKITGFLDDDPDKAGTTVEGIKVRGKLEDFAVICATERVDEAAVAISKASRKLLTEILDIVEFHVRQVHYIPDMYMLTTFSPSMRDVDGMPVIPASQGLLNPVNRAVKTLTDYAGALTAVIIFSPFMLWAAWRIKRTDGGKVFSQLERSGLRGKRFMMYKFRTSGLSDGGASLRRSYVDELPQLFNVLRGEMSLSGPKALKENDLEHVYGINAVKISTVKPGITGLWQISRHTENDVKICAEMNLYYIRNWTLWLDTVIMIRTLIAVFVLKRNYPSYQSNP